MSYALHDATWLIYMASRFCYMSIQVIEAIWQLKSHYCHFQGGRWFGTRTPSLPDDQAWMRPHPSTFLLSCQVLTYVQSTSVIALRLGLGMVVLIPSFQDHPPFAKKWAGCPTGLHSFCLWGLFSTEEGPGEGLLRVSSIKWLLVVIFISPVWAWFADLCSSWVCVCMHECAGMSVCMYMWTFGVCFVSSEYLWPLPAHIPSLSSSKTLLTSPWRATFSSFQSRSGDMTQITIICLPALVGLGMGTWLHDFIAKEKQSWHFLMKLWRKAAFIFLLGYDLVPYKPEVTGHPLITTWKWHSHIWNPDNGKKTCTLGKKA